MKFLSDEDFEHLLPAGVGCRRVGVDPATLVGGLGADRMVSVSDAVWTGPPPWQIEGLGAADMKGSRRT